MVFLKDMNRFKLGFYVDIYFIMIYLVNLIVYFFWGKFYDYRVIDFFVLFVVFVDDVIMVDGWEVK